MSHVRVHNFSISLDGYGAGDGQSLDSPMGHAGQRLSQWFFPTQTFQSMIGKEGGTTDLDNEFASRWGRDIGAEIMGRRKFGPHQGPWTDLEWQGWWGDEPPFHTPVIVMTHHSRPPLTMSGGTTFYFESGTPEELLQKAKTFATGHDVRLGGGATSINQFLRHGLVDYAHVVIVPIILGRGEHLWHGLEGLEDDFAVTSTASPSGVVHVEFTKRNLSGSLPW